jgi:hypothetical protein
VDLLDAHEEIQSLVAGIERVVLVYFREAIGSTDRAVALRAFDFLHCEFAT